jgi:hypothetical protein
MTTFHRQSVKRSRKRRRCTWCAESIEIGQPYESYRATRKTRHYAELLESYERKQKAKGK